MLKRIYIDNFRCLVNFELSVGSMSLFLGDNGSGKSTVFEALRKIQMLVEGESVLDVFTYEEKTRWQTSPVQTFELEVEGNGGTYKYELLLEYYDEVKKLTRISKEYLWFNGNPLLKVDLGETQLYRDNYSEGPKYPADWFQSVLASLPERADNTKLTWFREHLIDHFIIAHPIPMMMGAGTGQAEIKLTARMENFSAWYRYISEDGGIVREIGDALREVIDGFYSLSFERPGGEQYRELFVNFKDENDKRKNFKYEFSELSDGQRALIALYTIIYYTRGKDYTICIDEPEKFLALREIQPWIGLLYDFCSDEELQALLISHHPDLINYLDLATSTGYWFNREYNTPVRVKRITITEEDAKGVPISELVAMEAFNG